MKAYGNRKQITMELTELLKFAIAQNASDVFISAGLPLFFHKNGELCQEKGEKLLPEDTRRMIWHPWTEVFWLCISRG